MHRLTTESFAIAGQTEAKLPDIKKDKQRYNKIQRFIGGIVGVAVLSVPFVFSDAKHNTTKNHFIRTGQEILYPAGNLTPEVSAGGASIFAEQITSFVAALEQTQKQQLADFLAAVEADKQAKMAHVQHYGNAYARPSHEHWMAMHECEQPEVTGGWTAQDSSYGGGEGIANSTWRAFGGTEFAPLPSQATPDQQIEIANRIYETLGPGAWGCKTNIP
jgi:hypothetical protein